MTVVQSCQACRDTSNAGGCAVHSRQPAGPGVVQQCPICNGRGYMFSTLSINVEPCRTCACSGLLLVTWDGQVRQVTIQRPPQPAEDGEG